MSLEIVPPLELATTPSLLALEARAKVVLEHVRDGAIAAVVASVRPPAVAETTEPPTILLLLTIHLPEERQEGLFERLLGVGGDGVDGRMKSGVVRRIELGSKTGKVKAEVGSGGIRS